MYLPEKEFFDMWKKKPMVSADCVVIKDGKVLLVKRETEPYKGYWVLPGGLMDTGETIEQTAIREVKEETGMTVKLLGLFGVYSGPKRDPRGTTACVAFVAEPVKTGGKRDNETSDMQFFDFHKLPKMGFDHKQIATDVFKAMNHKCSEC